MMSKLVSVFKDFSISAVIAVLTANLIALPNLLYQIIITFLILALIFFILRSLDKHAKRMEILSILYCENLVLPLVKSANQNLSVLNEDFNIAKIKLYIVLPSLREDIERINTELHQLNRYTLAMPKQTRNWYVHGKLLDQTLLVFDTPLPWALGIGYLTDTKKIKPRQVQRILEKMSNDVKTYVEKNLTKEQLAQVAFIKVNQFEVFFK